MRLLAHPVARTLLLGAALGLIILGVGGRAVMALIMAEAGGTPRFTVGGTLTVVMLGAASGFAGAVMAIVSRAVTRRFAPRHSWVEYALLSAMLALVTLRGLRGTTQAGTEYFYGLVAAFGIALVLSRRRWLAGQSQAP
jgi:hypothetical protein